MTKNSAVGEYDLNAAGLKNTNGIVSSVTGSCTLCGKKSDSNCDRCGDFYCSELCQQKDWRSHRYICFPMPKLVKVGQSSISKNNIHKRDSQSQGMAKQETSNKNINTLPNGSCVLVTGFKSTNRCYIRSTNPSTAAECDKILNEINNVGKNSSALSEKPKINGYVLALRDGKWCRAQVLRKGFKMQEYHVFFIDFGDSAYQYFKDLKKLSSYIENLPCFAHKVQLKNIDNVSTDKKILKLLTQYTKKEYKVVFCEEDKYGGNVELYQWGTDISLNALIQNVSNKQQDKDKDRGDRSGGSSLLNVDIVKNELSEKIYSEIKSTENMNTNKIQTNLNGSSSKNCPSTNETKDSVAHTSAIEKYVTPVPRQIQKPCLVPPFEIIPLNENDHNCKVLIMDNSYIKSGFIGCLLEKYYENLKTISKFLKEYESGDQSYKPKFNEYCLANYEDEWYRAKVVEILSEDNFLVVYIDFTNEMELSSKSIRRYPMALNLPCCTTLCAIDGLPEDKSVEVKKFLEENCPSFRFLNVDSVRIASDIRYIKCTELLKQMTDSKLL